MLFTVPIFLFICAVLVVVGWYFGKNNLKLKVVRKEQ